MRNEFEQLENGQRRRPELMIAQGEKPYYAHGVIPSFTDPAFATLVACVIVAGEFLVGALCLVGSP
ncbi:MAG: hypothetical protein R3C42_05420 [Parvularculaceae bacterium]